MSVDSLGRAKVTHSEFFKVTEIIRNNLEQLQNKKKGEVLSFIADKMGRTISEHTLADALDALGIQLRFASGRQAERLKVGGNDKRTMVKTFALILTELGINPSNEFKDMYRRLVEKEYPQAVNGVPVQKLPRTETIPIVNH